MTLTQKEMFIHIPEGMWGQRGVSLFHQVALLSLRIQGNLRDRTLSSQLMRAENAMSRNHPNANMLRTDHSVVRNRYRPIRLLITRKYWESDRLNRKIDEEITENESRYQKGELLWWRG
jgi:hypothetical protein